MPRAAILRQSAGQLGLELGEVRQLQPGGADPDNEVLVYQKPDYLTPSGGSAFKILTCDLVSVAASVWCSSVLLFDGGRDGREFTDDAVFQ